MTLAGTDAIPLPYCLAVTPIDTSTNRFQAVIFDYYSKLKVTLISVDVATRQYISREVQPYNALTIDSPSAIFRVTNEDFYLGGKSTNEDPFLVYGFVATSIQTRRPASYFTSEWPAWDDTDTV